MRKTRILAVVLTASLAAAPLGSTAALADDGSAAAVSSSVLAMTAYDTTATGTLGTCTWTVADGVLTIAPSDGTSGTLAVHAWDADWYEYRESITSVVIGEGVTAASDSSYLFSYLENVTSFTGLSNLDVSNVTTMEGMFYGCTSVWSISLSGWDTSKVTNMSSMFSECGNMWSVRLNDIYTTNVTNMAYMFYSCYLLDGLDLSSFKTTNVQYMDYMFTHCVSLQAIYVSDYWSTASVTSSKWMFLDCGNLKGGNGTAYHADNTSATYARIDATGLQGYMTYREYTGTIYANDADTGVTASKQTQKITVKKAKLRKTIKYKKLKKKSVSYKLKAKTSGDGRITYKKVSGSKKITVNSLGRVTVAKGTKKGKYKIKVKITAAKTSTCEAKTVTKKIVIKVKK